jgi:hypothetical protein
VSPSDSSAAVAAPTASSALSAATAPTALDTAAARRIAELEAQVAGLEAALTQRSRELRVLQGHLCRRDLITLSRLSAGLPALARGTYEPDLWHETTDFTSAEVDSTLNDLWQSLVPFAPVSTERGAG